MNSTKKYSGTINNNKNKLNSKIILILHPNPNAYLSSKIKSLVTLVFVVGTLFACLSVSLSSIRFPF